LSNYELTYILRPLEEANLTTANERIATQVRNTGGEIVARNDWGRRRLAYPIRKIYDGYYTTLYLTLSGTAVRTIERQLKLSDDVLRFLFVRVETLTPPQAPAPVEPAAEPAETPAAEPAAPVASTTAAPEAAAAPTEPTPEEATATTAEGS
jgi:small subunit ribosomal protein S6